MELNRRVLVTGASRGIGKACALRLAQAGFDIVVHYNSREDLAMDVVEQVKQIGRNAHALRFDVGERSQAQSVLVDEIEHHGAFYGVVCNAGLSRDNVFPAMTGEQWDKVIHTNLDAFYNVLQPLVMPMIRLRQGGRIITLASVSGVIGNRGQTNYSAAKAGLIGATKALALELAKRKITVNCIAPGVIETEMTALLPKDEAIKAIPLQRFGQADEVASAVNFLMSDDASYITRQVISVNGGLC